MIDLTHNVTPVRPSTVQVLGRPLVNIGPVGTPGALLKFFVSVEYHSVFSPSGRYEINGWTMTVDVTMVCTGNEKSSVLAPK